MSIWTPRLEVDPDAPVFIVEISRPDQDGEEMISYVTRADSMSTTFMDKIEDAGKFTLYKAVEILAIHGPGRILVGRYMGCVPVLKPKED